MSFIGKVIDFLFPHSCEICGNAACDGRPICADCRGKFVRECFGHCPICGKTAQNCTCGADFTGATGTTLGGRAFFSLTFYKSEKDYGESDRVTEKLIFGLKEHGRFASLLAEEMSRGLYALFAESGENPKDWIITYPPRSTEKFYSLGFDQSEVLAEKLARLLGCGMQRTLVRGGRSAEQKLLDKSGRAKNAESTLVPIRRNIKDGAKYILLDDIITSGATVAASAELLYDCGAAAVFPVSVARTMHAGNKRGDCRVLELAEAQVRQTSRDTQVSDYIFSGDVPCDVFTDVLDGPVDELGRGDDCP